MDRPQVLIPYDPREAISLRRAALIAGKSESTVRNWCGLYFIGRRVVGGPWQVSRVALAMLLDGNEQALRDYLSGDRNGPTVNPYFRADAAPAKLATSAESDESNKSRRTRNFSSLALAEHRGGD